MWFGEFLYLCTRIGFAKTENFFGSEIKKLSKMENFNQTLRAITK